MQCCSIKIDGHQCTVRVLEPGRCKKHDDKFQLTGPNATRIAELDYYHKRMQKEIQVRFRGRTAIDRDLYMAEIRKEDIRFRTAKDALLNSIVELNQQRDDDPYIARRWHRNEEIRERLERRREEFRLRQQGRARQPAQAQPVQVQVRELEAFANDKQNVHTEVVVTAVKTMITKILAIPIPEEYRTETMKTVTEIIDQCKPSLKAVWQMTAKYCNIAEDIYEMGPGIYAKVLNAVWQFIKTSEHEDDLKKILTSELTDSVAMCAQGNLSRICNVLTGYMDGLDIRSDREVLADKMLVLRRSTLDREFRLETARAMLHNHHIPQGEWADYLEALEG